MCLHFLSYIKKKQNDPSAPSPAPERGKHEQTNACTHTGLRETMRGGTAWRFRALAREADGDPHPGLTAQQLL